MDHNFFQAVANRRSVRRYTEKKVPPDVVNRALDSAVLAPNSSNLQLWQFYWVRSPELKSKLAHFCLDQGAARTAAELVVVAADRGLWKKHRDALMKNYQPGTAPSIVKVYYEKLIPFLYGWHLLTPYKFLLTTIIGFFRPISRHPYSASDLDEIGIKSAALGAENFMLAISAQGFDTCPMEGFDEWRVKKLLKLSCTSRIAMVISIGERDPKGVWGDRFRVPRDWVIHEV